VGWGIIYLLGLNAQKKQFRRQIVNDAREKTVVAIREYEDWMCEVNGALLGLSFNTEGARTEGGDKLICLMRRRLRSAQWRVALEENEVLFPSVVNVRQQLFERHGILSNFIYRLMSELAAVGAAELSPELRQSAQHVLDQIGDMVGLVVDLRIHLQNTCLS